VLRQQHIVAKRERVRWKHTSRADGVPRTSPWNFQRKEIGSAQVKDISVFQSPVAGQRDVWSLPKQTQVINPNSISTKANTVVARVVSIGSGSIIPTIAVHQVTGVVVLFGSSQIHDSYFRQSEDRNAPITNHQPPRSTPIRRLLLHSSAILSASPQWRFTWCMCYHHNYSSIRNFDCDFNFACDRPFSLKPPWLLQDDLCVMFCFICFHEPNQTKFLIAIIW